MARIYDRPVWQLLIEYANQTLDESKTSFHRSEAVEWFASNYPLIKKGTIHAHLIKMSTNAIGRVGWNPNSNHNVFFALGRAQYRRYDPVHDPQPITRDNVDTLRELRNSASVESADISDYEGGNDSEFAFERDLQNFLVKNLHLIEDGLKLYEEDEINGVEYPVGGRRIDILAVDKDGALVVIELKVSKGHDRVIGQILRYLGWIKKNLAEDDQHVRGIIIAKEITDDLQLACTMISDISLREYSISFSVEQVNWDAEDSSDYP